MVRRACLTCGHIVNSRRDAEDVMCPKCDGYDFGPVEAKHKAEEAARKKAEVEAKKKHQRKKQQEKKQKKRKQHKRKL